jgi:hypothetical protein
MSTLMAARSLFVATSAHPTGGRCSISRASYGNRWDRKACTLAAVTQTETLTPTQAPERERTDEGDHDRFAHYAKKDAIARAYVTGEPIVALCGKKWVPSRDPSRFPVCPTCKELKEAGWTLR